MAYSNIRAWVADLEPFDESRSYTHRELELHATKLLLEQRDADSDLTLTQRRALQHLQEAGKASTQEVADALQTHRDHAGVALRGLVKREMAEVVDIGYKGSRIYGATATAAIDDCSDWIDEDRLDKIRRREAPYNPALAESYG